MKVLTVILLGIFATLGASAIGMSFGYQQGKKDAANALTPRLVVVKTDDRCHVYETGGVMAIDNIQYEAQVAVLLRPWSR